MVSTSQLINQYVYLNIRMHTYMHVYIMCVFKVSYMHSCMYRYTCRWFAFSLVPFYEAFANIELANTDHCSWGKYRLGSYKPLITTFLSIHSLVLYVFLFKDTLLNIYCQIINIELKTINTITHAWMLPNMCISARHITVFLHLVTLDNTSALHLKVIFNRKMNKKHNLKNAALNWPWKFNKSKSLNWQD